MTRPTPARAAAGRFWEWPSQDFCADLHNYTGALLSAHAPPLSNSISYGWQGELAEVGCSAEMVEVVDANWAKLAARGISILVSSGDSGSACMDSQVRTAARAANGRAPRASARRPWMIGA